MARIQHKIIAELDPATPPVQEIYSVILGVLVYHQGQEVAVLRGVIEAAAARIKQLQKGDDDLDEPIRKP